MSALLRTVDARPRLAGTKKLEILLFTLGVDRHGGRRETFGIDVSKVREVMRPPAITATPQMPAGVEGMVSLRGALVPVIDLARYAGVDSDGPRGIMIVTEYGGHSQGFLVEAVDTILRLDWSRMHLPPEMPGPGMGGLVAAVTELADHRLVMLLDLEKVLPASGLPDDGALFREISPLQQGHELTVYFADDSSVARRQISRTLAAMGVRQVGALNGCHAWEELVSAAAHAEAAGRRVADVVSLVLTDAEMPEMDGFDLTRRIKSDRRFAGVPVVMHSSLSGVPDEQRGSAIGVDEHVPMFEPRSLALTLLRVLGARGARPACGVGASC